MSDILETGSKLVKVKIEEKHSISQVASLNGKEESTPIFVSENQIILGNDSFEPVEKVMVWFQCNIESGTMLADLRSNAIELDLTETNTMDVEYADGIWRIVQ